MGVARFENGGRRFSFLSPCDGFQFSRRRENLTFSHHQEVQGRSDADELLDWCEETDPPRSREDLRVKRKAFAMTLNSHAGVRI